MDTVEHDFVRLHVEKGEDLFATIADSLGLNKVRVRCADEDVRAAQREQWDDANNFLVVSPDVVMRYDRNTVTKDVALLGTNVHSDRPLVLTDVAAVMHDFGIPKSKPLRHLTLRGLEGMVLSHQVDGTLTGGWGAFCADYHDGPGSLMKQSCTDGAQQQAREIAMPV